MTEKKATPPCPVSSGSLSGHVHGTKGTQIKVSEVTLTLDKETAWALCNVLHDSQLLANVYIEDPQRVILSTLGAALGRIMDHSSSRNGTREPLARVD